MRGSIVLKKIAEKPKNTSFIYSCIMIAKTVLFLEKKISDFLQFLIEQIHSDQDQMTHLGKFTGQ